MQFTK